MLFLPYTFQVFEALEGFHCDMISSKRYHSVGDHVVSAPVTSGPKTIPH
jgi:hypothetical protein